MGRTRRMILVFVLAAIMVASMAFIGGTAFAAQSGAGCQGLQNAYSHSDNEHVERDVARQAHDCNFT